jgi:hypothetical protein
MMGINPMKYTPKLAQLHDNSSQQIVPTYSRLPELHFGPLKHCGDEKVV